MILDIVFGVTFLGSFSFCGVQLSKKIAGVRATPEELIFERLHENPSKLRLLLIHFRTFYRERYHIVAFWNMIGKSVYRTHILLMRVDNYSMKLLRWIRNRYEYAGGRNGKSWKKIVESAVLAESAPLGMTVAMRNMRSREGIRRVEPPKNFFSSEDQ